MSAVEQAIGALVKNSAAGIMKVCVILRLPLHNQLVRLSSVISF